ncbi:hypothetical protein H310_13947 [Aphanomyces invadans]|uniref:Uncharacterized protein n=1 Tax=Aphanomyces invadans TaxID=157072 RepID=A0A024TE01_9STRA|nr:hypothetical protein H310_13947 [Aphanomyces invadans]ETV91567.1 hypothetical protein H310_13947 [Aphanomyces invadans]|eukprot:XP_008879835.1 hypothetical protein H310_13947 [Aphanomyces invadans]
MGENRRHDVRDCVERRKARTIVRNAKKTIWNSRVCPRTVTVEPVPPHVHAVNGRHTPVRRRNNKRFDNDASRWPVIIAIVAVNVVNGDRSVDGVVQRVQAYIGIGFSGA